MTHSDTLNPTYTLIRHCEERSSVILKTKSAENEWVGNERRGNLHSLTNWREVFEIFVKTFSQRTQCREIASRMQQCPALFVSYTPKLRLAMTAKRNEVTNGCNWLRLCHKWLNVLVMKGGA
jgi:hypothetical protein